MARIKHIAIRTNDIEKTAAFYREAFGLEQVGVGQSGIYLTDGYLNIAILSMRAVVAGETMKLGVDHVGFQVDDVNATVADGKLTATATAKRKASSQFPLERPLIKNTRGTITSMKRSMSQVNWEMPRSNAVCVDCS